MTNDEYFATKIEMSIAFYEERLPRIDAPYLAEIEKLAKQKADPVVADFFRDAVKPSRIASELKNIRFWLNLGKLQEADMRLYSLKNTIDFVDQHLKRKIFQKGVQFSDGPRLPRLDVLARRIDESLERLEPSASNDAILKDIEGEPDILEIDYGDKSVIWRNAAGRVKTTTFKTFQHRVTGRKKVFHTTKEKVKESKIPILD